MLRQTRGYGPRDHFLLNNPSSTTNLQRTTFPKPFLNYAANRTSQVLLTIFCYTASTSNVLPRALVLHTRGDTSPLPSPTDETVNTAKKYEKTRKQDLKNPEEPIVVQIKKCDLEDTFLVLSYIKENKKSSQSTVSVSGIPL